MKIKLNSSKLFVCPFIRIVSPLRIAFSWLVKFVLKCSVDHTWKCISASLIYELSEVQVPLHSRFPLTPTALIAVFVKSYTSAKQGDDQATGFREHLRDVEKDDKNASKLVMRHNSRTKKNNFQICTLNFHGINKHSSFN